MRGRRRDAGRSRRNASPKAVVEADLNQTSSSSQGSLVGHSLRAKKQINYAKLNNGNLPSDINSTDTSTSISSPGRVWSTEDKSVDTPPVRESRRRQLPANGNATMEKFCDVLSSSDDVSVNKRRRLSKPPETMETPQKVPKRRQSERQLIEVSATEVLERTLQQLTEANEVLRKSLEEADAMLEAEKLSHQKDLEDFETAKSHIVLFFNDIENKKKEISSLKTSQECLKAEVSETKRKLSDSEQKTAKNEEVNGYVEKLVKAVRSAAEADKNLESLSSMNTADLMDLAVSMVIDYVDTKKQLSDEVNLAEKRLREKDKRCDEVIERLEKFKANREAVVSDLISSRAEVKHLKRDRSNHLDVIKNLKKELREKSEELCKTASSNLEVTHLKQDREKNMEIMKGLKKQLREKENESQKLKKEKDELTRLINQLGDSNHSMITRINTLTKEVEMKNGRMKLLESKIQTPTSVPNAEVKHLSSRLLSLERQKNILENQISKQKEQAKNEREKYETELKTIRVLLQLKQEAAEKQGPDEGKSPKEEELQSAIFDLEHRVQVLESSLASKEEELGIVKQQLIDKTIELDMMKITDGNLQDDSKENEEEDHLEGQTNNTSG